MVIKTEEQKEKDKIWQREYYKNNKGKYKKYYQDNKEHKKTYDKLNRDKINKRRRDKYNNDIQFKLRMRMACMFSSALKKYIKTGVYPICRNKDINYKAIIDKLTPFKKDRRKWDIDHIIPLKFFDLTNPIHIKKAWDSINIEWVLKLVNLQKCAVVDFKLFPKQKEVYNKLNLGSLL